MWVREEEELPIEMMVSSSSSKWPNMRCVNWKMSPKSFKLLTSTIQGGLEGWNVDEGGGGAGH